MQRETGNPPTLAIPEMAAQDWVHVSWGTWLALAFSSVLAAALAYVIWFKSIGEIGASKTVIYNNLIPPVAIFVALALLGERLSALQALGAAVILVGVALTRFVQTRAVGREATVQALDGGGPVP